MSASRKITLTGGAIAATLTILFYIGETVPDWGGLRTLVLIWVIGLGIIALGIVVAERFGGKWAPLLIVGMLAGFTILADLSAIKMAAIQLGGLQLIAPAGSLLFAVLYFGGDYLNELYGRRTARINVYAGFLAKIAVALGMLFVIFLMPGPDIPDIAARNETFDGLLSLGPRINVASIVSILVAGLLNVELFGYLKRVTGGRHLWLRSFLSSSAAIVVDNIIFTFGAFLFVLPTEALWNISWTTSAVHITIAVWSPAFLYLLRYLKQENIVGVHERLVIPEEEVKSGP